MPLLVRMGGLIQLLQRCWLAACLSVEEGGGSDSGFQRRQHHFTKSRITILRSRLLTCFWISLQCHRSRRFGRVFDYVHEHHLLLVYFVRHDYLNGQNQVEHAGQSNQTDRQPDRQMYVLLRSPPHPRGRPPMIPTSGVAPGIRLVDLVARALTQLNSDHPGCSIQSLPIIHTPFCVLDCPVLFNLPPHHALRR